MPVFTKREIQIVEYLRGHTIKETAKHFEVKRNSVDYTLWAVRNKIEDVDVAWHLAAQWKDGKRNQRLAKLLRRQEPKEDLPDEES